jgi:tetratricopeptide (TPR) repeat protein
MKNYRFNFIKTIFLCILIFGLQVSKILAKELDSLEKIEFENKKAELINMLAAEKYPLILKNAREVIELNDKDVDVHYIVGMAKHKMGNYQNAIYSYDKAIEIDKDHVQTLLARAQCYKNLEFYGQAEIDYGNLYRITEREEFLLKRAFCRFKLEKSDEALQDINTIKDEDVHGERDLAARIYYAQGKYEEAKKECYFVFKNEPENDTILDMFIDVLLKLENYDEILKVNEDIFFKSEFVKDVEALAMAKLKKYDKAVEKYQDLLFEKKTKNRYNGLANMYMELGKEEEALKNYELSIGIDPFQFDILLKTGNIAMNNKLFNSSLRAYNKAIDLDKKNPELHLKKGISHFFLKEYKDAIKAFKKTLKYRADDELAVIGFIYSHLLIGKDKFALKAAVNGTMRFPDNGLFYVMKALILIDMDKVEEAETTLSNAKNKKFSIKAPLYIAKAILFNKKGDFKKAMSSINLIGSQDTILEKKYYVDRNLIKSVKAEVLINLKKYEEAIKVYRSIKTGEFLQRKDISLNIGDAYFVMADYKNAILNYDTVLRIDPYNLSAIVGRAKSYHLARNFKKAEDDIIRGLDLSTQNIGLFSIMSEVYLEQNREDIYKRKLEKANENIKDKKTKLFTLAMLRFQNKEYEKALKTLKRIATDNIYDRDNTYIYNLVGQVLLKLDDPDNAIPALDMALKVYHKNYSAAYHKAQALYTNEEYKKALTLLNDVLESNEMPNAYLLRAESYKSLKKKDKACEDYKKAGELGNKKAYSMLLLYCK